MKTSDDNKPGWADDPAIQQRIIYALYVICGLLIIADLLVDRHSYLPVEEIPAFYAFYGFAALVGLVELSKALRKWIGRDEDYYDRDDANVGDDNRVDAKVGDAKVVNESGHDNNRNDSNGGNDNAV